MMKYNPDQEKEIQILNNPNVAEKMKSKNGRTEQI